jgi:hypothetical protein
MTLYRISKGKKVEVLSDVGDDDHDGKHRWREVPGRAETILDACLNPAELGEDDEYRFVVTDEP